MGKYRALIVACDFYTEDFAPIPHTVEEARGLGEALSKFGYQPFEVRYYLDDINSNVQEAVGRFFQSAAPDDFILFYFGGHGRKEDDGELYLVLRDTRLKELITTSLQAVILNKLISKCPARNKVIVLDACYSAAIEQGSRADSQQVEIERYLQQGKGTAILTSTNAAQLAYSREDRRSFTYYLTEGIKNGNADKNGDGIISLDEWFDYAREGVRSWQGEQEIQNPQIYYKSKEAPLYIGRVITEEPEDTPVSQIRHSSVPPLTCGIDLITKRGILNLLLVLGNPNTFVLTSVEIWGFTEMSSELLHTIERMSAGESVEFTAPIYRDTGQLLQLVIRAKDAHGRSFLPAQLRLSELPDDSRQGATGPRRRPSNEQADSQSEPASRDLDDDDEDESVLHPKKKKPKSFR